MTVLADLWLHVVLAAPSPTPASPDGGSSSTINPWIPAATLATAVVAAIAALMGPTCNGNGSRGDRERRAGRSYASPGWPGRRVSEQTRQGTTVVCRRSHGAATTAVAKTAAWIVEVLDREGPSSEGAGTWLSMDAALIGD